MRSSRLADCSNSLRRWRTTLYSSVLENRSNNPAPPADLLALIGGHGHRLRIAAGTDDAIGQREANLRQFLRHRFRQLPRLRFDEALR